MKVGYFIGALVVAIFSTAFITYYYTKKTADKAVPLETSATQPVRSNAVSSTLDCDFTIYREKKNFKYISPILLAETYCESSQLAPLKEALQNKVSEFEKQNTISRASIYFKEVNTNRWIELNGFQKFYPGSMLKVALMINILKQAEEKPMFLDKLVTLNKKVDMGVVVNSTQQLTEGAQYKISELLEAMIVRSDNNAVSLLNELVDQKVYKTLFNDLGLDAPAMDDWSYSLTATEFAKIYRILYNASFLKREYSEWALSMLSRAEYENGLTKFIPDGTLVAHKFGERFTESNLKQFHESGIVYVGDKSYVVVIMTEGEVIDSLQNVVAQLSKLCYENAVGKKL
jgi:beta-lactamase class A